MQESFVGNWTRQSHVSVEHLNSVRGLNRRFLELAGKGLALPGLGIKLAPLSIAGTACRRGRLSLRFIRPALRG